MTIEDQDARSEEIRESRFEGSMEDIVDAEMTKGNLLRRSRRETQSVEPQRCFEYPGPDERRTGWAYRVGLSESSELTDNDFVKGIRV